MIRPIEFPVLLRTSCPRDPLNVLLKPEETPSFFTNGGPSIYVLKLGVLCMQILGKVST